MSDAELLREIRAFLAAVRTASLATVDAEGHAHAANVQFVLADDLNLVFVSSPNSAHSKHIAIDPRVAMSIYEQTDEPSQIHGLQLHGRCEELREPGDIEKAWSLYVKRFTFVLSNPAIEKRVRSECFYRVMPTWLRWIDNRRGFGFKAELVMGA